MLELIIDDKYKLDLPDDFSLTMNYISPLFNDQGSSSYTCKAPLTHNNKIATKFSNRLGCIEAKKDFDYSLLHNKIMIDAGKMKATNFNKNSFDFYLKPNESEFYSQLKGLNCNDITGMPFYNPSEYGNIWSGYPTRDYVNFPVFNNSLRQVYSNFFEHYQNLYNYAVYQQEPTTDLSYIPFSSLTHFVFLNAALLYIFKYFNYAITNNAFDNDAELRNLCLYNNILYRPSVDGQCSLQKHMPQAPISDLLGVLKDLFGAVFIVKTNPRKEVKIRFLKDILNGYETKDFSSNILKIYEKEVDSLIDNKGYSLTFATDESYFSSRIKSNFKKHGTTVNNFNELPSSINATYQQWDVVNVKNEYAWYKFIKENSLLKWVHWSDDFTDETIRPIGFEINANSAPVLPYINDYDCTIPGGTEYPKRWLTPRIDHETFFYNEENSGCPIRLMFYRGLQRDSRNKQYPFGSSDVFNYQNTQIGNYAIKWQGPNGLYEKFLKDYINWTLYRKTPITFEKIMSAKELRDIEWDVKHRINGNEYLLDKIGVTYTKKYIKPAKINAYLV